LKLNGINKKYQEDDREMIAWVNKQMCKEYEEVVKSYKQGKEKSVCPSPIYIFMYAYFYFYFM